MDLDWAASSSSGGDLPHPPWLTAEHNSSDQELSVDTPRDAGPDPDSTKKWLDQFDFSEFGSEVLDELLEDAADDFEELDIDGDEAVDFLVELGFAEDESDEAFATYDVHKTQRVDIGAGAGTASTSSGVTHEFPEAQGEVVLKYGKKKVWAVVEGLEVIVGKTTHIVSGELTIGLKDVFKRADLANEEGATVGVGQGFSMFFHCAACLAVSRGSEGVLEPEGGGDVRVGGETFEITGRRAVARESKCTYVLNKYAVLSLTASDEPFYKEYKRLSLAEDLRDHTMYVGSAFDQGDSEYSASMDRIARARAQLRPTQLDAIRRNSQRWVMEEVPLTKAEKVDHSLDPSSVLAVIAAGGKERDGVKRYHCPFRVLPPRADSDKTWWTSNPRIGVWSPVDDSRLNQDAEVITFNTNSPSESDIPVRPLEWMAGKSTSFHTLGADLKDMNVYSRRRTCQIETEREGVSNAFSYHFGVAMNFPIFQYAYVQSELLPKIQGKAGYFYSKHSKTGITWSRSAANSLVWRVSYYQFTEPELPELVGEWCRLGKVWRSPHFTVSRNDIGFASVLPYRMVGTLASVSSLLGIYKLKEVLPKLMVWMATVVDSSWRTTELCADSRFLTTVWLSRQKNVQEIVDNQLSSRRELRHCDHLYLTLVKKLCENSAVANRRLTPLLQLPLQLACLEKDWPLAMQWHIRESSHGIQCMKKIIKAHKLERDWRDRHAEWYAAQASFLERTLDQGVSSEEFDRLFEQAPEEPAFNAVLYIGMSYVCASDLRKLGDRGTTSGFSMSGMISDRNCTELKVSAEGYTTKPKKVADCLAKLVKEDPDLSGAYEYFVKSMVGDKIPNVFTMHAKDQKSGEREIAQMHFAMRVSQFLAECMSKLYCEVEDADLMTDPEKYSKVVSEFMDLMSDDDLTCAAASEDRTFFCGNFLPEAMGLALYINALDAGSTGLVSTAALMMRNTRREVIFPTEYGTRAKEKADEIRAITEGAVLKSAKKIVGRKAIKTHCMEMRTHMMQGIFAHTAAVINTTFVKAMSKFQAATMPGLLSHVEHTTSDDVGRAATFKRTLPGVAHAKADFCERPVKVMKHVMMANSERKHMTASHVIEFNNAMITRSGMVPQAPIHAHLSVQPLTSLSPFNDLMVVASAATQTLAWGDSPDVAVSAVSGAKEVFKQKWLPSANARGLLDFTDFLPSTLSELVSGFDISNEKFLNNVLHLTPPENIEAILRNEMGVATAVAGISIKTQKKRVDSRVEGCNRLLTFKRRLTATIAARRNATRMNPRYAQPLPVAARKRTMELMAYELMKDRDPHDKLYEIKAMLEKPKVTITRQRLRRSTRRPTKLGSSARAPDPTARNLRLWEYAGVQYGEEFDPSSVELPSCREGETRQDLVAKFLAKAERKDESQGRSFKAPGGLPMHHFHDNQLLLRPMAFNFRVELQPSKPTSSRFVYRGEVIQGFTYCGWGGKTLRMAMKLSSRIAFGWAMRDNATHIYFSLPDRSVRCVTTTARGALVRTLIPGLKGESVAAVIGTDWSTIDPSEFGVAARGDLAGIAGDNTAMLNYGSFLNTNLPTACKTMKLIFSAFKSNLPNSALNHAPKYPTFPQNVSVLPSSRFISFKGSYCARRVRIEVEEPPEYTAVTVDLSGESASWEAQPEREPSDGSLEFSDEVLLESDDDIEMPSSGGTYSSSDDED